MNGKRLCFQAAGSFRANLDQAREHGRVSIGEIIKLTGAAATPQEHFRQLVEKGHLTGTEADAQPGIRCLRQRLSAAFDCFNNISESRRDNSFDHQKISTAVSLRSAFLNGGATVACHDVGLAAKNARSTLLHVHQLEESELAFFMIKK